MQPIIARCASLFLRVFAPLLVLIITSPIGHAQQVSGLTLGDPSSKCDKTGSRPCWLVLEDERRDAGEKETDCTLRGGFAEVIGKYVVYTRRPTIDEFSAWGACITDRGSGYSTSQCCRDFAEMWAQDDNRFRPANIAASVAFGCSISERELLRGGSPESYTQDPQSVCYVECLGGVGLGDGKVFAACLDGCATYAINFNSRAIIDRLSSCKAFR